MDQANQMSKATFAEARDRIESAASERRWVEKAEAQKHIVQALRDLSEEHGSVFYETLFSAIQKFATTLAPPLPPGLSYEDD